MPAPRVSVLLPARNAAPTLAASLRSVARQSFADFRCIVVDDGSGDESAAIAEAFAAGDARFCVVANAGRGLVDALQTGLRRCDGDFVARMDADDLMHRHRLRRQLEALAPDPGLAGVGCHVRAFPGTAFGAGLRDYVGWLCSVRTADDVAREAFVECPLLHPTWLLRTDVLRTTSWRDVPWPEDYDLLLRLLQRGHRLSVVPRRLHAWRRGPRTATATDPRYAGDAFPRLKAAFLATGLLADTDRYVLWGHGVTGRRLKRELLRLGRRPAAIVELHPRRLGQTIDGAPVVPPASVASLRALPIVVSVAGAGPRKEVRAFLQGLGLVELRDFVCAA
jgi:glycosyltransferase involved in cell wall biosynthesis